MQEEVQKQLDEKVVELKKARSRLEVREEDFITIHEQQTKVAAEREQLRKQTANKTSESVKEQTAVNEGERSAKRA